MACHLFERRLLTASSTLRKLRSRRGSFTRASPCNSPGRAGKPDTPKTTMVPGLSAFPTTASGPGSGFVINVVRAVRNQRIDHLRHVGVARIDAGEPDGEIRDQLPSKEALNSSVIGAFRPG